MSLSLAAKYSERVAFKMSTAAVQFSFTSPVAAAADSSPKETVLSPMNLRMMEFELMQRLNFKVGESSNGPNKTSMSHERVLNKVSDLYQSGAL